MPSVCAVNNSVCKKECPFRYTTAAACNADPECKWETLRDTCSKRCSWITTQTDCMENTMCEWDGKTKTCRETCQYRFNTVVACNAALDCQWDVLNSRCVDVCEKITNASACVADSLCVWDGFANPRVCRKRCEISYTSQPTCNNDPACLWDTEKAICRKDCDFIANPSECTASPMCVWKPAVGSTPSGCVRRCPQRTDQPVTCDADSECMWDNALGRCKDTCASIGTQGACNADSMCVWDHATSDCRKQCAFVKDSTTCGRDYRCEWNPSGKTPQVCETSCEYSYGAESACDADHKCMWDPKSLTCKTECSRIAASAACVAESLCRWSVANVCAVPDPEKTVCGSRANSTTCAALGCCFEQSAVYPSCFASLPLCQRSCKTRHFSRRL